MKKSGFFVRFIEHGADINPKDNNDKTPLYYAKQKGYQDIANLLKQHGAHK